MPKYSVYLQEKVKALSQSLTFFGAKNEKQKYSYKRLVVFLAQIDFWEWEISSLIYSFESFAKRSLDWQSFDAMISDFREKRLALKKHVVGLLKEDYRRGERVSYYHYASNNNWWAESGWKTVHKPPEPVIAPVKELNELIDSYNNLLKISEEIVLDGNAQAQNEKFGTNFEKDLSRYRKERLEE